MPIRGNTWRILPQSINFAPDEESTMSDASDLDRLINERLDALLPK